MKFKYGKGSGDNFLMSFGNLLMELPPRLENKTLKQIAKLMKKQFKIKDGEIEFKNIIFNYVKAKDKNDK